MSKIHLSKNNKRKAAILVCMLALIVGIGVINNRMAEQDPLTTSSDYADYEQKQMDEHDGEVLVDSIHLSEIPGPSTTPGQIEIPEGAEETTVITSDDYQELTNASTYFSEIRATIDMDRNEIISMLTDVIAEADEGSEKNNATQQKMKIIEYMNAEKVMENLIENKGFAEALVIMTDTSVNVTVNKQELTQSDVAKIQDIVIRETNRPADQIVIQCKS